MSEEKKVEYYDVRVVVVGNVDSGKSTLTGVLVSGERDNGRGSARSKVFVHQHEQASGRTSFPSHHILGFQHDNTPIYQTVAASASAVQKNKSWASVVQAARNTVTFIDLCGHEAYLRTTISGITGNYPDYALLVINALAGITKMTKEHMGVLLALNIPICIVVTKMDLVPSNVLDQTKLKLFKILKSPAANKLPLHVRVQKDIETVVENNEGARICPVFFVSSTSGENISLLTNFLARIRPRPMVLPKTLSKTEMHIEETFQVSGIGLVVSGCVRNGVLQKDHPYWLGPYVDGSWIPVTVRTLHQKRVAMEECVAPLSCSVSLKPVRRKDLELLKRELIRKGMVLVDEERQASRVFEAEVVVMHHQTTIKRMYQAVIHCGHVRQTAQLVDMRTKDQKEVEELRTNDKALVTFQFLKHGEYLHEGMTFVFCEGGCRGVGKIVRLQFTEQELQRFEETKKHLMEETRKRLSEERKEESSSEQ